MRLTANQARTIAVVVAVLFLAVALRLAFVGNDTGRPIDVRDIQNPLSNRTATTDTTATVTT